MRNPYRRDRVNGSCICFDNRWIRQIGPKKFPDTSFQITAKIFTVIPLILISLSVPHLLPLPASSLPSPPSGCYIICELSDYFNAKWRVRDYTEKTMLPIPFTVFLSILNEMDFHLVKNRKENCHHDQTPFNMKGNGILVFSVHYSKLRLMKFLKLSINSSDMRLFN